MKNVKLEPTAEDLYRLIYEDASPELAGLAGAAGIACCCKRLETCPEDFEAAYRLGILYERTGAFDRACQVRFDAVGRIEAFLEEEAPTDEPLALDWEWEENRYLLEVLQGSAIDHFLIDDFELSAGMLELLLELDPEDHLGVTQTLAYCYVALEEYDAFDELGLDLDSKEAETALVRLWCAFRRGAPTLEVQAAAVRQRHPELYREFTAAEHPVTEAYLLDIDGEHPSRESRSRESWLKTEPLWRLNPEFIDYLKTRS